MNFGYPWSGLRGLIIAAVLSWVSRKVFLLYVDRVSFSSTEPSQEKDVYIWPSKHDYLEDLMSLKEGYFVNHFSDETSPCSFGQDSLGRQNAAEWIRTAFHDVIDHNASSGEGGLDASIMFELDRQDNVDTRPVFETTLQFMNLFHTPRSSMADLLALGVYISLANCHGPQLSFRAGRQDASGAGASGALAPMPHQDLDTHRAVFSRAGFCNSEMIALVACGHTLGGVHPAYFPSILAGAEKVHSSPRHNVVHFEATPGSPARFDNAVVLEYLSGTGSNLLLHSANETFHSDKRIFGSDGNTTMGSLANPSQFRQQCATLFNRMINLVPQNSQARLSPPLQTVDVKPYVREQSVSRDGSIRFSGRVRVRVGLLTARSASDLAVELSVVDRSGTGSTLVKTVRGTKSGGVSAGHFGDEFAWFEFGTTVPSSVGMKSFDIRLIQPSTGHLQIVDNAGRGFPVSDRLLYQPRESCLNTLVSNGKMDLRVVAAVHDQTGPAGAPRLDLFVKVPRQGVLVPAFEKMSLKFEATNASYGGYRLYRVETPVDLASWNTRFDIVADPETKVEFLPTNILRGSATCQEI